VKFSAQPAQPEHADLFVRLAANAYAHLPEHERPRDRAEFVAHTHGPANPAGRGIVVLAEDAGRAVGHVSAIPFRYLRRDGALTTGWQVSCFVVDATVQRQGVGQGLFAELLAAIGRDERRGFVFTHPNPRSHGLFLRFGARELVRARTLLVPPALRGIPRDEQGRRWSVSALDVEGARAELSRLRFPEPQRGAFLRDADFFRWRFLDAPAAPRYRFARAAPDGGGESLLLALGEHRAHGVRFTILVDAVPDPFRGRFALAVRAARSAGGSRPLYLTTNARWKGGPLALSVPRSLDPRPVFLVLFPGHDELAPELAEAPILTGDWMSF